MDKRLIIDQGNRTFVNRTDFKSLFKTGKMVRLCGACNALAATIIEEAGFEGIWLSSFESHATCRLPDADILTVSDYSEFCNKISDRISIPILVDGDAMY